MASKKPSISYETGLDPLDPEQVTGPLTFTRYAAAVLGCDVPIGGTARGTWYTQLKEEMAVQGWTWEDMVGAVQYAHRMEIPIRRVYGIFYYVQESRNHQKREKVVDLHLKVAAALAEEPDEEWVKRLSLAKGKALEQVYEQWERKNESVSLVGDRDSQGQSELEG